MSRPSSARDRRVGILLAAVGSVAIACGPGFLDGISGGARPEDAGTSVSESDAETICNSRLAPVAPTGTDDPSAVVTMPTLAFERMRFDTFGSPDAGGPPPIGLDLDRTCTCPQRDSCVRQRDAGASCDTARGEDNTLAKLFNDLNIGVPLFPQTFATDRIRSGQFTVLVDVLGWNGEANDPKVAVIVRLSQFSEEKKNPDVGDRELPLFDGKDVWTVDPDSVASGDAGIGSDCRLPNNVGLCLGRARDDNAYVKDGVLVARPRRDAERDGVMPLTVRSSAGRINLAFRDFTMLAEIRGQGATARLSGELTGSVSATSLLESFANMEDFTQVDEPPICDSPAIFSAAKTSVCAARDLAAPGKGPDTACEYVSVAISFGASPAIAGTIYRKDTNPNPCGVREYGCD